MPRRSKKGPQPAPVLISEELHGEPDDVTHELENYIPQHQEDHQATEKKTKLHQAIGIVEDRVARFRPRRPAFMQRLSGITTVFSVDEEGGCRVNIMNVGLADWDVHFWTEPVPPDECPDRVDILAVDDDSDEKPQPSISTAVSETLVINPAAKTPEASQATKYQHHHEGMSVLDRMPCSQILETPRLDEEGDLAKEDPEGGASFRYPLSCYPMRYIIPRKLLIQRQLQEVTELDCIPHIEAQEQNVIIRTDTGPLHLSWVAEKAGGGVPVWSVKSNAGIDQLFIVGVHGKVEKLKGRKKERFLDDLARIQVAYASITSPHLGPLIIRHREDSFDRGLFSDLPDDEGNLVADIVPTAGDAARYLQHVAETNESQHVAAISQLNDQVKYIPGPYPLIPPQPLIQNVEVNPVTGNIINLNNSHETESVPWEIAAQCPLSLSGKNQAKYRHSLKRHFLGAHMRREIASEVRLDQLMFTPALEIVGKLLELQNAKDGIEYAAEEVKMSGLLSRYLENKLERRKNIIIE